MTARLTLSPEETSYYDTLFSIAGPDMTGFISGKSGAQFLSTSGLDRDALHKIWSISDVHQSGRLDRDSFNAACRLVAHAQSGRTPDVSLTHVQPGVLPMFEGLKKSSSSVPRLDTDVISISDFGEDRYSQKVDAVRASNIAHSLTNLGIDPLEFIPFQSGPDTSPKANDWTLREVERQKYITLFRQLEKNGCVDGKSARKLLEKSGLRKPLLGLIWEMSDMDHDGSLNLSEFVIAMHLATKCKKGSTLPKELPLELLDQKEAVPRKISTEWKYTLPTGDMHESVLASNVDETEEEMRYTFDLCAQTETDINRMKIETDKSVSLVAELSRELRQLTERKLEAVETRKRINIDKISLGRDKATLRSEIGHLKNLISEGSSDVDILRNAVKEIETEVARVVSQTSSLGLQRKDALRQHQEELGKIETEQKETAQLIDSFNQLGREEEVKLQSQQLRHESQKIIQEMQRNPYPARQQGRK